MVLGAPARVRKAFEAPIGQWILHRACYMISEIITAIT